MEDHLGDPLRVAALVQSKVVPRWISDLIAALDAAPFVELATVEVATATPARRTSFFAAYEWLDRRVFRSEPDALAPVRVVDVGDRLTPAPDGPDDPLRKWLAAYAPDVVLNFAPVPDELVAAEARFGAWRLVTHALDRPGGSPTAFEELRARDDVVGSALVTTEAGAEGAVVLQRSYAAVDLVSLHRTRNRLLWKSMHFVPRTLETLHRHGWNYLREDAATVTLDRADVPPRDPRWPVVLAHALSTAAGVLRRRLRRLLYHDEWFVAIRRREPSDVERRVAGDAPACDFEPILVSADAYAADPFLFEHLGRSYLFFERFSYRDRRGSIWCCALDAAGKPGELVPVLDPASHVSYPCVFASGDGVYMVPESEEAGSVALYEASVFPTEWRRADVLLDGVLAVDPTIVRRDGSYWLFVNITADGASEDDELHLFFSETLFGDWQPHPRNPVVTDVRRARCAGRIFELNGSLIRPSQDCGFTYGHALTFNRIETLTPTEYAETSLSRIEATWAPHLSATHTYGFDSRFEVVDGNRRRLRPLPFRSTISRFRSPGRATEPRPISAITVER